VGPNDSLDESRIEIMWFCLSSNDQLFPLAQTKQYGLAGHG
jgi:hypothetical protein